MRARRASAATTPRRNACTLNSPAEPTGSSASVPCAASVAPSGSDAESVYRPGVPPGVERSNSSRSIAAMEGRSPRPVVPGVDVRRAPTIAAWRMTSGGTPRAPRSDASGSGFSRPSSDCTLRRPSASVRMRTSAPSRRTSPSTQARRHRLASARSTRARWMVTNGWPSDPRSTAPRASRARRSGSKCSVWKARPWPSRASLHWPASRAIDRGRTSTPSAR
jgi:hypothetical protein